jgi:hypothetical protein
MGILLRRRISEHGGGDQASKTTVMDGHFSANKMTVNPASSKVFHDIIFRSWLRPSQQNNYSSLCGHFVVVQYR